MTDTPEQHWTVDRRVPLTLVLVLAGQIAVGIVWGSKLDSRVEAVETVNNELRSAVSTVAYSTNKVVTELAVLQSQQSERAADVKEIRAILRNIEKQISDEIMRQRDASERAQ